MWDVGCMSTLTVPEEVAGGGSEACIEGGVSQILGSIGSSFEIEVLCVRVCIYIYIHLGVAMGDIYRSPTSFPGIYSTPQTTKQRTSE